MKKSPLKRTNGFKRPSPGKVQLRRTRLKRVGKRKEREKGALALFRSNGPMYCEECDYLKESMHAFVGNPNGLDAHHLVPRSIAAGHPNTHHIGNRAWLCRSCHSKAHEGKLPHLILPRTHLDTLS